MMKRAVGMSKRSTGNTAWNSHSRSPVQGGQ